MSIRQGLSLFILAVLAIGTATVSSRAEASDVVPPPLSYAKGAYYQSHPAEWQQFLSRLPKASAQASTPASTPAANDINPASGTWTSLTNNLGVTGLSNPLLLSDGTVIVHPACSGNWYRLTPDNTGSYINGSWSQIGPLPSGYAPLYFASAVLPDGRVIINGGEYNGASCQAVWTNLGAIYDPSTNTWSSVSPPSGWTTTGDAQSIVLPNLTYMLADCCSKKQALLNASTLTWTSTGTNKFDVNDEEGWTLLPSGKVLAVDAYVGTGTCGTGTEVYDPSSGSWSSAGNVPQQLADCNSTSENGGPSYEMGPQVLRPDGTVIAFGATTNSAGANAVAHSAIYNSSTGAWTSGPDIPTLGGRNYNLADAPAAVVPSGNVLFAASPGLFNSPTHYFEFDGAGFSQVNDPAGASGTSSYEINLLVLPTGQVLMTDFSSTIQVYTPQGSASSSWAPSISSLSSTTLQPNVAYQVVGTQLSGLTQGGYYGDDSQSSTNYPIVRISNNATGHVFYARTADWSTTSVAPKTSSTVDFALPSGIETGDSTLVVIANGIPSQPVAVNVQGASYVLQVSVQEPFAGVTSSPAGINCGFLAGSSCAAQFSAGTQVTLNTAVSPGWMLFGWLGDCVGPVCVLTMNRNASAAALIIPEPPPLGIPSWIKPAP